MDGPCLPHGGIDSCRSLHSCSHWTCADRPLNSLRRSLGLLLGSRWGLASMGLYLLVGAIGIPVFAGGKGGFAHFFGPTGGYLFGYVLAAWVTGLISERSHGSLILDIFAVVIGSLCHLRPGSSLA